MPYATTAELPSETSQLSGHAKEVFRRVFNAEAAKGHPDSRAFATAWTAVKNGWTKQADGTWARKVSKGGARTFLEVLKNQPSVGDVHVDNAGALDRKSKTPKRTARTFHEVVSGSAPGKLELGKRGKVAPLYVHRPLKNAEEVIAWAKSQGFKTTLPPDEMHTTVLYSKTPMDWDKAGDSFDHVGTPATSTGWSVEALGPEGAHVLRFSNRDLERRHDELVGAGGSHDFPEYLPHVTISYAPPADLSKVEPYTGRLDFGPEEFEEIKPDGFDPKTIMEKLAAIEDVVKWAVSGLPHPHAGFSRGRNARPRFGRSRGRGLLERYSARPGNANPIGRSAIRQPTGFASARTRKADRPEYGFEVEIEKADDEKRQLFGWASITHRNGVAVVDKQDDIIPLETELEPAVYDFVEKSREGDDMHVGEPVSHLIESTVFTPAKARCGLVAKDRDGNEVFGWWTGWQIDDPGLWDAYKRGERPELSIGGSAVREAL